MTGRFVLGPDIDLDNEEVFDSTGQRLTEARAEKIGREAVDRAVGRPSLSTPGRQSPEIKARVPQELRDELVRVARERGTTTSALVREALELYLAS